MGSYALSFQATWLLLLLVLPVADRSPAEILSEVRSKGNEVPKAVFEELARQRSPEALDALIKGLVVISKPAKICEAYAAFAHFQGVPQTEEEAGAYLAECARGPQEQLALHATLRLGSLWPSAQEALVELAVEHATADGRSVALMGLVEHGMPLTDKQVKSLVRSKDPAVRYEGLLVRTYRMDDDAKRARAITKLARSKDPIERLVAAEVLATQGPAERFELLREHLNDGDPRLVRKAIASLERARELLALEVLIARLTDADRGERERIARALRRLTGQSFGAEAGRWQRWWAAEGAGFELPAPEVAPAAEPQASDERTSASFYGLPVHAERVVFAIDASDSMKKAGEGEESRIAVAKRELSKAIEGLPDESLFDVVHFGKSAWSWQGELVPGEGRNKRAAQDHVADLELSWGTEIYGALREAFQDPRADTILFLTDGDPQLSLMQDRTALRRIVVQWNRTRHTAIDCITIGTERGWLRELAELTDGRYQVID